MRSVLHTRLSLPLAAALSLGMAVTATAQEPTADATQAPAPVLQARVIAPAVIVREAPDTSSPRLGTAPSGAVLNVAGVRGEWAMVQHPNGSRGFVERRFLELVAPAATPENTAVVDTDLISLYAGPTASSNVIGGLQRGEPVQILSRHGDWLQALTREGAAWVFSSFLRLPEDTTQPDFETFANSATPSQQVASPTQAQPARPTQPSGPSISFSRPSNTARTPSRTSPSRTSPSRTSPARTSPARTTSGSPNTRIASRPNNSAPSGRTQAQPGAVVPQQEADPNAIANFAGNSSIADPSLSQDAQYQHYVRLIRAHGYDLETGAGQRTVLGLRGVAPNGREQPEPIRPVRAYNCTFVVLWTEGDGRGRATVLAGGTTPGQTNSTQSPDGNGDGVGDVAHIRPGRYTGWSRRTYKGRSAYDCYQNLPTYRDTNHDGRISQSEIDFARQQGLTASGILFHRGNSNRPASIGCQTMSSPVFAQFEQALGGDGRWDYILIDPRTSTSGGR